MKFKKADEMEMHINFKAMRLSYVFLVFSMFFWMVSVYIKEGDFPEIPFLLFTLSGVIFWASKLYMQKKIVGDDDEE